MPFAALAVPGPLQTRTGGFIYDRRIADGLRARGWSVDIRELDDSFPHPTDAAIEQAARAFAGLPPHTLTLVDGLALSAMPETIEHAASRLRIIALVHQPLAAAFGIDRGTAARIARAERRALRAASLVVVTGAATLSLLQRYGLNPDRVVLVEPGTDRVPARPRASTRDEPCASIVQSIHLLCVATISAGKGHQILLRALARVPDRPWHLTCAGSVTRDLETVERVRETIGHLGLESRVVLVGDLDAGALAARYDRADIFVLATLGETYGMAVAEALAHGLPVVSTATGAIPRLVGGEGGLVVPPGDEDALAAALARVLGDDDLRRRLADGARHAGQCLPTWDQASSTMAAALESLNVHG